MMDLTETKAGLGDDLAPQSVDHWVRIGFAAVIAATGIFVIMFQCLQTGRPGWTGIIIVFGGVGIAFTRTVIALSKALLPFKTPRNGQ